MKKIFSIIFVVSLFVLYGCDNYNDKNFEGLDDLIKPTNMLNIDYKLTDADYELIGDFSKANKYIVSTDHADKYFTKWLASTYFSADPLSVARLTFDCAVSNSDVVIKYAGLEKSEDYLPVYGEGKYAPFFNETTKTVDNLVKCLVEKDSTCESPKVGQVALVGYNYNEKATPQEGATPVFNYDFESLKAGDITSISGGWFVKAPEVCKWQIKNYNKNNYIQYSAKTNQECIAWLVTPGITVEGADKKFAFDVAVGNWKADCLFVLISTDFNGKDVDGTWTDVTANFTFPKKESGYSPMVSAGVLALDKYAGKKIWIAFRYVGDGTKNLTTTYQIDNIVVGTHIIKPIVGSVSEYSTLVCATDGKWEAAPVTSWSDTVHYMVAKDYVDLKLKDMRFSDSYRPESYLPTILNMNTYNGSVLPKDGEIKTIVYRYYSDELKVMSARASVLKFSALEGRWLWNGVQTITRQYAFDGSVWMFDPSTTVTLKAKGDKPTSAFYQAITDWAGVNKGSEYVTSYKNNDYYYGGSAYQNNFDFRVAEWRKQNGAAYEGMSDEELTSLMFERLSEAFVPGLEAIYPKAEPVAGVKVVYTVNFFVYDGTKTTLWTIKYEVTGKGKFTYIEDSLKEVK